MSEDGVLTDWFRKPHARFGTTYRLINLVVLLQLLTIVLSRGDVYVLGEAYAFGVVWSFAFKSLAMFVLRFTQPDAPREWRVPINIRIGAREIPVGLGLIALVLFSAATINLFTKQMATISGVIFTMGLYAVFVTSEHITRRQHAASHHDEHTDQFQLLPEQTVGLEELHARPGSVLVPVRDFRTLPHLDWILGETDTEKRDVVVMTIHLLSGPAGVGEDLVREDLFTNYEQMLFTRVVAVAERQGRAVKLLVVPTTNIFDAVAQTAVRLRSTDIVVGASAKMSADAQAQWLGEAWERTPHDRSLATRLVVFGLDGRITSYSLGAHAPNLSPDDVDLVHRLWVEAAHDIGGDVHHRDVVVTGLRLLEQELRGPNRQQVLDQLKDLSAGYPTRPGPPA